MKTKRIIALALCTVLMASVFALASCGKKDSANVEVVSVKIENATDGTVILDSVVEYTKDMTVLQATVSALMNANVPYTINEEGTALISIDNLTDFIYSEEPGNNCQWIYDLNGENSYASEETYSPATQTLSANDVIVWHYDVAVAE